MSNEKKDYSLTGSFNFAMAVIESAFKAKNKKDKETNNRFVESKFLALACDCSHNLETNKMKKLILNRNKI